MTDADDRRARLMRWRTMHPSDQFDNYYRAVNDVHLLRLRCAVLSSCVGRMYDARREHDRLQLVLEAKAAHEQFKTSFERDGKPLSPIEELQAMQEEPVN